MFQFGWWKCKARKGDLTHWQRWDGAYYLAVAGPLNCAYPLAVVLIYVGKINYPDSRMWTSGWFPNTPHGIILYILKWIGTGLLAVGVFKVTQLHKKIMKRWHALRATQTGNSGTPYEGK